MKDPFRRNLTKFDSDGFSPVDFSSRPTDSLLESIQNVNTEQDDYAAYLETVPRHQMESRPFRQILNEALNDPDFVQQAADETGDSKLKEKAEAHIIEQNTQRFLDEHTDYFSCDQNLETLNHVMEEKGLKWTDYESLCGAYKYAMMAGLLEFAPGKPRPLSVAQRNEIARICQQGSLTRAAELYIEYSFPKEYHTGQVSMLHQPEYQEFMQQLAWDLFYFAQLDYAPLDGFVRFAKKAAAGRPITVGFLQFAWSQFRQAHRAARAEATNGGLDSLTDNQVAELTQRTLSERAKHDQTSWNPQTAPRYDVFEGVE